MTDSCDGEVVVAAEVILEEEEEDAEGEERVERWGKGRPGQCKEERETP